MDECVKTLDFNTGHSCSLPIFQSMVNVDFFNVLNQNLYQMFLIVAETQTMMSQSVLCLNLIKPDTLTDNS